MATVGKSFKFLAVIILMLSTSIFVLAIPNIRAQPVEEPPVIMSPDAIEGNYRADVNWVKTVITLDRDGTGKVTVFVNCTPEADHIGMYLAPLTLNEPLGVIAEESFAINDGQTLSINHTAPHSIHHSYIFYIEDTSAMNTNETILYQLTYRADFNLSKQIYRYTNEPETVAIDISRPLWKGSLEYQELEIILPIDVGSGGITPAFLNESKYSVWSQTSTYYNVGETTTEDGLGNYLFTITTRKNTQPIDAPYDVLFYIAKDYFSLPKIINWVVIFLTSLFSVIALGLFIVVIQVKNNAEKEVTDFKNELYQVLNSEIEEDTADEGK